MPGRDIVVVGTSAGGVEALRALVGGLPPDFPGSIFIVMHTSPDSPGVLAQILDRSGPPPTPRTASPSSPATSTSRRPTRTCCLSRAGCD